MQPLVRAARQERLGHDLRPGRNCHRNDRGRELRTAAQVAHARRRGRTRRHRGVPDPKVPARAGHDQSHRHGPAETPATTRGDEPGGRGVSPRSRTDAEAADPRGVSSTGRAPVVYQNSIVALDEVLARSDRSSAVSSYSLSWAARVLRSGPTPISRLRTWPSGSNSPDESEVSRLLATIRALQARARDAQEAASPSKCARGRAALKR